MQPEMLFSCAYQVATLAHAINSNVVNRDFTGVGKAWPDGPNGGPRHNSTEANVVFRGPSPGTFRTRACLSLLRSTPWHAPWAQAAGSATTLRRASSSRRGGSIARAGSLRRRTTSAPRWTS